MILESSRFASDNSFCISLGTKRSNRILKALNPIRQSLKFTRRFQTTFKAIDLLLSCSGLLSKWLTNIAGKLLGIVTVFNHALLESFIVSNLAVYFQSEVPGEQAYHRNSDYWGAIFQLDVNNNSTMEIRFAASEASASLAFPNAFNFLFDAL